VAFAKGVCRALGVPLLSAPSLLGAARAACPGSGTVVAEYDALRGEVYRAVYRFRSHESGGWQVETLAVPQLVRSGARLSLEEPVVRAGSDGASAAALVMLVGVAGGASEVRDPASWEPAYGRPAEAEARLLARHGELPRT
jgi:tRNA A37 threonylcarbamoyladenosine modification protein TsaB